MPILGSTSTSDTRAKLIQSETQKLKSAYQGASSSLKIEEAQRLYDTKVAEAEARAAQIIEAAKSKVVALDAEKRQAHQLKQSAQKELAEATEKKNEAERIRLDAKVKKDILASKISEAEAAKNDYVELKQKVDLRLANIEKTLRSLL